MVLGKNPIFMVSDSSLTEAEVGCGVCVYCVIYVRCFHTDSYN